MWIIPIIILIGAAITSARTGLVAFFIVYLIYIFVGQKGISRKVMSLVIGVVALFSAYSLYKNVRQQSSIRDILFDSSDRDNGYEAAYNLFLQNPIFGHGFSIDYISSVMGQPIPHLSFLQYLVHGGIFYTLILFGVIFVAFLYAKKRKMNASWLILLTVLGTCLVPDIFSTRYITLLIVLVFLENETANQLATKNSNVGISLANMARLNFSPIGKKMGVNRGQ
nr:O-antigen ligase family protein [Cohnella thailandensis]